MANQRKKLGTDFERAVAKQARAAGLPASRVPLSGAVRELPGDVELLPARAGLGGVLAECKVRAAHLDAKGARILSLDLDWLAKIQREAAPGHGVVIARAKGGRDPLVLCDLSFFLALLRSACLDTEPNGGVE